MWLWPVLCNTTFVLQQTIHVILVGNSSVEELELKKKLSIDQNVCQSQTKTRV